MGKFIPEKRRLKDLLEDIDCGKIKLPSFQRKYKWTAPQVKKLLDSIQNDHPAGSLLFLAVDYTNPLIPEIPFTGTTKERQVSNIENLVLDGQQRLTSCYCAFYNLGAKTYFLNYKKLMEMDKNGQGSEIEFEELILDKKHMDYPEKMLDDGLMPFCFVKSSKTLRDSLQPYKNRIRDNIDKRDVYDFLDGKLSDYLESIFEYEFPVVTLPKELTLDAVCKVFQTLNSTGLKLSSFDICVAKFVPQGINLKDKVEEAEKNLFVKIAIENDENLILQAIALLAGKSPKKNSLAVTLSASDINNYWDKVISGIENTMLMLEKVGAGTGEIRKILPYTPIIPLFTAILVSKDYANLQIQARASIEQKLKLFFYTSALSQRYTEGTDNKLKEDCQAILIWLSGGAEPSTITNGVMWNTSKYLKVGQTNAIGRAILCLINSQKPKDFYDDSTVGYGNGTADSQIHHIFPEAEYKDSVDNINSIFNFTFLTKEANNFISNKTTKKYLKEILEYRSLTEISFKQILEKHIVDDECYQAMQEEDYNKFLESRAECIKQMFIDMGLNIKFVEKNQIDEELDDEDLEEAVEQ